MHVSGFLVEMFVILQTANIFTHDMLNIILHFKPDDSLHTAQCNSFYKVVLYLDLTNIYFKA